MEAVAHQIFVKIVVVTSGSLRIRTHGTLKRLDAITGAPATFVRLIFLLAERFCLAAIED
jgi:hypothetical protein